MAGICTFNLIHCHYLSLFLLPSMLSMNCSSISRHVSRIPHYLFRYRDTFHWNRSILSVRRRYNNNILKFHHTRYMQRITSLPSRNILHKLHLRILPDRPELSCIHSQYPDFHLPAEWSLPFSDIAEQFLLFQPSRNCSDYL